MSSRNPTVEPSPRSTWVLVVDDNPENLTALGDLLSGSYRVRTANSGLRALAMASISPQPELILLDIMMPGMDGYEVVERLRADPATRDIPVIFVTAMNAIEDEARGFELGAVDYITKPLRPAIVLARVRTQLELKHARDRLAALNHSLEAEVERRMAENRLVQDVTIHALRRLAQTRDNETGLHLRRTQEYVRTLAQQLRVQTRFAALLDARSIELMAMSAPLHDIGKVGIPDRILLKPGPLTADEWIVMRTHARLGAEAIEQAEEDARQPIPFLAYAKQIALCHHERWDGSGYPDGLAGAAIPIAARLMSLADAFDAMTCARVYKPAIPFDVARREIVAGRGGQFDPDVVDAFDARYDAFCDIATRFAENANTAAGPPH